MAKKRARGGSRELTRAEQKAMERRAASAVLGTARPTRDESPALAAAEVAPAQPGRSGVLPPRVNRAVVGARAMSREEELVYIRYDLRRLVILSVAMILLIIVLGFVVPYLSL